MRLGIPDASYYAEKVDTGLPDVTLRRFQSVEAMFRALPPAIWRLALTAERGSAWTLMYPDYSVVVPKPGLMKVPLAYPIARHDAAFAGIASCRAIG